MNLMRNSDSKRNWFDWLLLMANEQRKMLTRLAVIAVVLAVCALAWILSHHLSNDSEPKDITIEESPIELQSVMPKGEIMVATALLEDFATETRTEKHLLLIEKKHTCVQILKMKCSYKVDLDRLEYSPSDSNRVVRVSAPKLELVMSLQDSPFTSDDEEYWSKAMPNTNALKQQVAAQIRRRFDTPDNRRRAQRYAEDAIVNMIGKFGYEVEFVRTIERSTD